MFALQTRKALTIEQINEACYVDMRANKDVFESMRKNPKVKYDGERFSYKVTFYGNHIYLSPEVLSITKLYTHHSNLRLLIKLEHLHTN